MSKKSFIELLPQELIDAINAALRTKTIHQVVEHMRELGVDVSASAIGRHKRKGAEVAAKINNSILIAQALGKEISDDPDDKLTGLIVQLLQSLIFKAASAGSDPDELIHSTKEIRELCDAAHKLSASRKLDADRVLKIEQAAVKRAATAAEKVLADTPGITKETIALVREQILGVAA